MEIEKNVRLFFLITEKIAEGIYTINILWDKQIFNKLGPTIKINIYKSLVRSVLTYGAEVWILNSKFKSKLASTEMDFLRRSARCSKLDRMRNEEIRKRMDYGNSKIEYIHNKQLKWFGL